MIDDGMPVRATADALLATKLSPPRMSRAMIARPRLLDMLDAGDQGPLTLLAAPAGAGKSALVSSWIGERRPPGSVAWLSLDTDDADRRHFWRAVLEALTLATGDEAVASLAVSPREPMRIHVIMPALVDALIAHELPVTLVLDDFHEVADVVHEDIDRLARFAPPALRLIIVTRSDPPIALGRLRVDGRLTEIRATDLAFTLVETSTMFEALGVHLAPEDLERLWQRTEGWAAVLHLAAVSLRNHPQPRAFIEAFAGTDLTISDYLVSEVLAHQPSDLREFLLHTSIVETLHPELADVLTGRSDGHAMIARLEQGGVLTTPLDEHGIWHRYHPLFAELLRAELRAQLPHEVDGLHRRAAAWLAGQGHDTAALRHAATGCAWDLAAELVTARWMHLLIEGEMGVLRPVMKAMPHEHVRASPELALAYGGALLTRGDHVGAAPYLRFAEENAARVPTARRAQFTAGLAAMGLYEGRARGDPKQALQAARHLLDRDLILEGEDVSGGVRAFVLAQLGIVELWTGDLEAATDHLELAMRAAYAADKDWIVLAAGAHLATVAAIRGDARRAVRHAQAAVDLARRRGWTRTEHAGAAHCILAALALEQGRNDECAALLYHASEALHDARDRPLRAIHALLQSLLLAASGQPDAALDVLVAGRDELGDWPLLPQLDGQLVAQEALLRATLGERELGRRMLERAETQGQTSVPVANALAKLHLLEGDAERARAILAPHVDSDAGAFVQEVPPSMRAEAWLIDALALDALAERDAASRSLERALDLAEPAGLSRVIVAQGNSLRSLLRRHVRHGTAHPAIVAQVLEALEHRGGPRHRAGVPLGAPLSDREQTVLRLLPTMMSNQEIAGELYVSVNTVKTHLKTIYRKLGAAGRRDAVRRGRELGLMP
jgi:LuxR family transcriptional regulator, maltose regulon positive regulatory protein